MCLIERDHELAVLRGLLADCQQAKSRVAVITGGVATGRTSLLRTFGKHAQGCGSIFLGVVASPSEKDVQLGVLEQVLSSPDLPVEAARQAANWLETRALTGPDANGVLLSSTAVRELWALLRELTEYAPAVLAVDDVHYADEASLRCLLYLVRRLRSARLLTILTENDRARAASHMLQTDFLREPHSVHISIRPLSVAGVGDMLARRTDAATADRLAQDFHDASAGHPTLVRALLDDHLENSDAAQNRPAAGQSFGWAVVDFMRRHEAHVMKVAQAVAILGKPAPMTMLGRLLDLDVGSITQAVGILTAAGMLEDGLYRHDAVRAAVVNSISPDLRRRMHNRAAALLHAEGASPAEAAEHIVMSNGSTAQWVVPILGEAAEQALAEDDLETAIRYLRAAYQMCSDIRQRMIIASALADAESRADPAAPLRYLPEFTRALKEGLLGEGDADALVTSLLWNGRVQEAKDVIESCLEEQGERNGVKVAVQPGSADIWFAYLYPGMRRVAFSGGAASPGGTTELMRVTPEQEDARALLTELGSSAHGDVATTAERILERSRLNRKTAALLCVALAVLIYSDMLDDAAAHCGMLIGDAFTRSSPTWRALFTAMRALVHLRRGELAQAKRDADAALDLLSLRRWGIMAGLPIACSVLVKTATGQLADADALLNIAVPEEMFQTPMGVHYLYARGRYHLAANRSHAALHDFRLCGKIVSGWECRLPDPEPWRLGIAQVQLSLGAPDKAGKLTQDQLVSFQPRQARVRAMALPGIAATREPQARPAPLEETARTSPARPRADEQRAEGPRAEGGAARHPGGGAAGQGLSEAEQRVAALAAEGLMNREISERLFITVSTVEQHLTKVYRKLRVRRFELKSALQRRASAVEAGQDPVPAAVEGRPQRLPSAGCRAG